MKINKNNIDTFKPSQIIKAICLHCDNAPLDDGQSYLRVDMYKLLKGQLEIEMTDDDFNYYCKAGTYEN